MNRMKGLDLFSGIGGISYALSPYVRTIAYCECNPYAQAVLLERMTSNDLDSAPIWDDVRTLNAEILDTEIDIIFGGFPCQDISVAGHGKGLEGERSGLFFEIMRLAKEFQPTFIFLENVPAITGRGLDSVASEIAALGHDCRWGVLSAYDVGAPHIRERWFLLGYSKHNGFFTSTGTRGDGETPELSCQKRPHTERQSSGAGCFSLHVADSNSEHDESNSRCMDKASRPTREQERRNGFDDCSSNLAESLCRRYGAPQEQIFARGYSTFDQNWWEAEPNVGRVADGIPFRVDRLKCLGNSVVPQTVQEAFKRLMGLV